MRIERASALLAVLYANAHSKNRSFKLTDFMPHEVEAPIDLETAMKTWN